MLLRRVTLDLTGLPPTPDELRAFLADASPDAYEKVVDRLLASPALRRALGAALDGRLAVQRLGRLRGRRSATASRTSGGGATGSSSRSTRTSRTTRWCARCSPATRSPPADPQTVRATGYLVRSWFKFNRNVWMEDVVEHTGKAFLGLTLNCAKCHDHMYDPVSQKEYYQFRAIFEPYDVRTDPVPGGGLDTKADGLVRVFDANADAADVPVPPRRRAATRRRTSR